MRIPGIIQLLPLMLVLFPDSGISQSVQSKECPDCVNIVLLDNPNWIKAAIKEGVQSYKRCPRNIIRFALSKDRNLCGRNHYKWVERLMECLDQGNCLDLVSSDPNKKFSKGDSINPSTTTQNSTTTPHVTTLKTTTTEKIPDIIMPRETTVPDIITPTETTVTVTPAHHDAINNRHQGEESSMAPTTDEYNDGKMSHISLILIILVMVAVGTGVFCYKKKALKSISYTQAPSQDTLEMVRSA